MRGLTILDVLIIVAVLALLLFLGSRDFVRYAGHTVPSPTAAPKQGN